jgi:hypothetical protein
MTARKLKSGAVSFRTNIRLPLGDYEAFLAMAADTLIEPGYLPADLSRKPSNLIAVLIRNAVWGDIAGGREVEIALRRQRRQVAELEKLRV